MNLPRANLHSLHAHTHNDAAEKFQYMFLLPASHAQDTHTLNIEQIARLPFFAAPYWCVYIFFLLLFMFIYV